MATVAQQYSHKTKWKMERQSKPFWKRGSLVIDGLLSDYLLLGFPDFKSGDTHFPPRGTEMHSLAPVIDESLEKQTLVFSSQILSWVN